MTRARIRESIDAYRSASSDAAFERTFERDKSALRRLGMRLQTNTLRGEPVYSLDRNRLWLSEETFSPSDKLTLGVAARLWSDPHYARDVDRAVRRLGYRDENSTEPHNRWSPALNGGGDHLDLVLEALAQGTELRFNYRRVDSFDALPRIMRPWGVGQRFGHWYVGGWDSDRKAFRTFRLSRMSAITQSWTTLPAADPEFSMARVLAGITESQSPAVKLTFPTHAWPMVMDWVEDGTALRGMDALSEIPSSMEQGQEGSASITVDVPDIQELIRCLAELGGAVTVEVSNDAGFSSAEINDRVEAQARHAVELQDEISSAYTSGAVQIEAPRRERHREASERRFVRLVDLASFLGSHQGCTTGEIAKHLDIPPSQVNKDLMALANAGSELLGSAYMMVDAHDDVVRVELPRELDQPLSLAPDQTIRLVLALHLLGEISPGHREQTRGIADKLAKTVTLASVESDQLSVHLESITTEHLSILREAADEGRHVGILYRSRSQSSATWRTVRPTKVYADGPTWYVSAADAKDGLERTYRVASIRAIERETPPVPGVPAESTATHGGDNESPQDTTAHMWVDASCPELSALMNGTQLGQARISRADGSSIEGQLIEVRVRSWFSLYRMMLHHAGRMALWQPQLWAPEWRRELYRRRTLQNPCDPSDRPGQPTHS